MVAVSLVVFRAAETHGKIGTGSNILFLINAPESVSLVDVSDLSGAVSDRVGLDSDGVGAGTPFSVGRERLPVSSRGGRSVFVDPIGPFVT